MDKEGVRTGEQWHVDLLQHVIGGEASHSAEIKKAFSELQKGAD